MKELELKYLTNKDFKLARLLNLLTKNGFIILDMHDVINIDKYLCTVEYDYPNFHLKMECFICSLIDGHLELVEAEDAKFITNDQLDNIDFLPADLLVVKELKKSI